MNNPTLLLITSAILVLVGAIFWGWASKVKTRNGDASIHPAVAPTGRTILSGTTPYEMTGKASEELRNIAKLPDSGWTEIKISEELLDNVSQKAKSTNTFSVLNILITVGTATKEKIDGIDQSWRGDYIRPDKIHVSQSLWDAERGLYVLDEWLAIEEKTFVNSGVWGEIRDRETINRLSGINNSLLPEAVLAEFSGKEFEHAGLMNFGETSFVFLQTTLREDQGIQMRHQLWIDEKSMLIRKHRLVLFEGNSLVAERVITFLEYANERSINKPEWLNMDSTNTIVNTSVCIVEHW